MDDMNKDDMSKKEDFNFIKKCITDLHGTLRNCTDPNIIETNKAYINEKINWNTFCDYAEVINRIFMEDVELLLKIYNDEKIELNGINIKYKI